MPWLSTQMTGSLFRESKWYQLWYQLIPHDHHFFLFTVNVTGSSIIGTMFLIFFKISALQHHVYPSQLRATEGEAAWACQTDL